MSTQPNGSSAQPTEPTAEPTAEPTSTLLPPADSPQWKALHKLTPISKAGATMIALLTVFGLQILPDYLEEFSQALATSHAMVMRIVGITAAALVVLILAIWLISYLMWRKMAYVITSQVVGYRQGIFFRKEKAVRLARVQSVDLTYSLWARIFRLAELRVVSSDSSLTIGLLAQAEAHRLRSQIMRGAGNLSDDGASAAGASADGTLTATADVSSVDSPSEGRESTQHASSKKVRDSEEFYRVNNWRLLASFLFSATGLWGIILLGNLLWVTATSSGAGMAKLLVLVGSLGAIYGVIGSQWGTRASLTANGAVRLRAGLIETKSETIPADRLCVVEISRSIIWGFFGWWRMSVAMATSLETVVSGQISHNFIPVGTYEEVRRSLHYLLGDLGVGNPDQLLHAMLYERGTGGGLVGTAPAARWMDPIRWSSRGATLTPQVTALRSNRWGRRVTFIVHARAQSISVRQGPIERIFDLAGFEVDTPGFNVTTKVKHLSAPVVGELVAAQRQLAAAARVPLGAAPIVAGQSFATDELDELAGLSKANRGESGTITP